jgi:hypothetical protein
VISIQVEHATCFHVQLIRPSRWRRYLLPKRHLTFNELYGRVSQKADPFNQERSVEETSRMGNRSAHKTLSAVPERRNALGSLILNCCLQRAGVKACVWPGCFRMGFAGAWEGTDDEDSGSNWPTAYACSIS